MLESYIENKFKISYQHKKKTYDYYLKSIVFHSCINKDKFYYACDRNKKNKFSLEKIERANIILYKGIISENEFKTEMVSSDSVESNTNVSINLLMDEILNSENSKKIYSPIVLLYVLKNFE